MKANEKASLILAERRRMNKVLQEERKEEIYKKIPQVKAIDELIKQTGFDSLKLAASKINTESYEEKIKKLREEKNKLLILNGYKTDYNFFFLNIGKCSFILCQVGFAILMDGCGALFKRFPVEVGIRRKMFEFVHQTFLIGYY